MRRIRVSLFYCTKARNFISIICIAYTVTLWIMRGLTKRATLSALSTVPIRNLSVLGLRCLIGSRIFFPNCDFLLIFLNCIWEGRGRAAPRFGFNEPKR
jgi:hypothetical protein